MPFSLRLDPATEAKVRRLAASTGRSRSQVLREAMAQYELKDRRAGVPGGSAFDRVKSFAGIVRTGGEHFSKDTHAKYGALVGRKHRGRRSR